MSDVNATIEATGDDFDIKRTIRVVLELDEDDFRDFAAEIEFRRGRPSPDGESNYAGSVVGEMTRDLRDYRVGRGIEP